MRAGWPARGTDRGNESRVWSERSCAAAHEGETAMKKVLSSLSVLVAGLVVFAGSAVAQDPGVKIKEISFEDDVIEGELQMPNGTNITGLQNDDLSTLIRAREDFVDQLLKSVEDL